MFGTRKVEVPNSLIMKITANENDINDSLQTSPVCNALMMRTGVIETFAKCRLYRFHWP